MKRNKRIESAGREYKLTSALLHLLALCAGTAFGGTWQMASGTYSGAFDDTAHWSGGIASNGGTNVIAPGSSAGAYTIIVPSGGYSTTACLTFDFYPNAAEQQIFDAGGTSFLLATQTVTSAVWPANALNLRFNGNTFFTLANSGDSRWNKLAQFKLTDGSMSGSTPDEHTVELAVHGGKFDAYAPDGNVTRASSGALPTPTLFNSSAYNTTTGYGTARLRFTDGASSDLPSLTIMNYPIRPELVYEGGTHYLRSNIGFPNGTGAYHDGRTNDVHVTDGATLTAAGALQLNSGNRLDLFRVDGASTMKVNQLQTTGASHVRFDVTEGSTLALTGTGSLNTQTYTELFVDVTNRSTLSISGSVDFGKDANSATDYVATNILNVLDSTLEITGQTTLGQPVANQNLHRIELNLTDSEVKNSKNAFYNACGTITSKNTDWTMYQLYLGRYTSTAVKPTLNFDGGIFNFTNTFTVGYVGPATAVFASGTITNQHGAAFSIGSGSSSADGTLLVEGGKHVLDYPVFHLGDDGGKGLLVIDGDDTEFVVNDLNTYMKLGGDTAGGYGRIIVSNGLFKVHSETFMRCYVGYGAGSTGVLDVVSGKVVADSNAFGISSGTGFMNFIGGETELSCLAVCTENNAAAGESVIRQTGGKVTVAPYTTTSKNISAIAGVLITSNGKTDRKCRLALDGGELAANYVMGGSSSACNGGTGWTAFKADGGKLTQNAAGPFLLETFDEAKLGQQGLVIDSNGYDSTIRQDFTDPDDATGEGLLLLTGAGTKTLAGTNSAESLLVVAGGTVTFTSNAVHAAHVTVTNNATLAFGNATANGVQSLTVGDSTTCGYLQFTAGETPVVVNGDVTINNTRIVLSGDFPADAASYALLKTTGTLSPASVEAWQSAFVKSGLGSDRSATFATKVVDGVTTLEMTVTASESLIIRLSDAGATSNVTESITFGTEQSLTTIVATNATLNVNGPVMYGALIKEGDGRTMLGSAENVFYGGVTVSDGVLAPASRAALGCDKLSDFSPVPHLTLTGAALELPADDPGALGYPLKYNPTSSDLSPAVIKNESDLTINSLTTSSGLLVKRGAGRLVIEASGSVALGSTAGLDVKNTAPHSSQVTFGSGGLPSDNWTTLTVAEGELVLKGTSDSAAFTMSGTAASYIGIPAAPVAAQPGLVVDHASATLQSVNHFHLGSGCASSQTGATAPYLILTNGATLNVTSFRCTWNAPGCAPKVRVDDSILDISEYLYALESGTEGDEPTYRFTNGAKLLAPYDSNVNHSLVFGSRAVTLEFDASSFEGRAGAYNGNGKVRMAYASGSGKMIFRNGSTFKCDAIGCEAPSPLTLQFDDSEWTPGTNDYTFTTLNATYAAYLKIETTGGGLKLAPPADKVWTVSTAITGDGGLVKSGAGTLAFTGTTTLNFDGALDVREGAVSIASGAAKSGAKLTGSGAVTNAALTSAIILAPLGSDNTVPEILTFKNCTFVGTTLVDFGRTSTNKIERPFPTVTVAKWSGASAPDISGWKLTGTGESMVAGVFSIAGDEIRVTPHIAGMMIRLR